VRLRPPLNPSTTGARAARLVAGVASAAAMLVLAFAALALSTAPASAASYRHPPARPRQWYWEIDPPRPGLAGLPAIGGAFPAPGAAAIWDTDLFADSNVPGQIPTGPSPVVTALHRAGIYSICYLEAGAYQTGFPDNRDFSAADYGHGARRYQMQGYANEWWFNLAGFAHYVTGRPSTLKGVARNIAAGLEKRIAWCAREGQDAIEPDDLDGYTNRGETGVRGGGWHLTGADSRGFERWLVHEAHAHGLAAFQKNDPANAGVDASTWDGMIIEECNYYNDPCAGSGGDATPYLTRDKPVLNAEYTSDGESTGRFCDSDVGAGITGALFDVDLDGRLYQPCPAPAQVR
jgi:hypothetical protein